MNLIEERKAKRIQFLRLIYEKIGGAQFGEGTSIFDVGKELGLAEDEATDFATYWYRERCISLTLDGIARMMPHGADLVEKTEGEKPAGTPSMKAFPTPPGTTWQDVHVSMSDFNITIEIKDKTMQHSYQDVGFEDRRRKKMPDTQWELLKLFAVRGGIFARDDRELGAGERKVLKNRVSQLRRRLKTLVPKIDGDPITYDWSERCYRTTFKIRHLEELQIRTSPGTTWTRVSMIEAENGLVRISFPKTETTVASQYTDAGGERVPHGEVAQHEATVEHQYDLGTLGLESKGGTLSAVGEALLTVLRGGGLVRASQSDKGMLKLTEYLSHLLGLEDSPFDFNEKTQSWQARFEASSESSSPR